ncbi:MAG: hypothetical protein L0Z49_00690 [Actinobacteria bacterium]|nr:hypothetical protein [Actinomycetota bacterium]
MAEALTHIAACEACNGTGQRVGGLFERRACHVCSGRGFVRERARPDVISKAVQRLLRGPSEADQ